MDASSDIPKEDYVVLVGEGIVRREGGGVTIVGTLRVMRHALQAAERLAQEGIGAEVIDPRTLVPFDCDFVNAW